MSEEGFFRRWARLKSTGGEPAPAPAPAAAPVPVPQPVPVETGVEAEASPLPTLEDVARLTPDADFSAFVSKGVDQAVRRLALKKLFADPHFNAIDGLDMYMSDYNKAAPLPPGMLASLKHAPGVLSRLLGDQQEAAQAQAGEPGQLPQDMPEQIPQQMPEQIEEQIPAQVQIQTLPSTQQGNT